VEHPQMRREIDRIDDYEKAEQGKILEYPAIAALPRLHDIFPHTVPPTNDRRSNEPRLQDAERNLEKAG
jgi:hypothetical protein